MAFTKSSYCDIAHQFGKSISTWDGSNDMIAQVDATAMIAIKNIEQADEMVSIVYREIIRSDLHASVKFIFLNLIDAVVQYKTNDTKSITSARLVYRKKFENILAECVSITAIEADSARLFTYVRRLIRRWFGVFPEDELMKIDRFISASRWIRCPFISSPMTPPSPPSITSIQPIVSKPPVSTTKIAVPSNNCDLTPLMAELDELISMDTVSTSSTCDDETFDLFLASLTPVSSVDANIIDPPNDITEKNTEPEQIPTSLKRAAENIIESPPKKQKSSCSKCSNDQQCASHKAMWSLIKTTTIDAATLENTWSEAFGDRRATWDYLLASPEEQKQMSNPF